MSMNLQEADTFLKFDSVKGPLEYEQYTGSFVVDSAQLRVYSQGLNRTPRVEPFTFFLRGGATHLATFTTVTHDNQKKLKKAVYTKTLMVNGKREPTWVYTMEDITVLDANGDLDPGSGEHQIVLRLEFAKLSLKTTDYKPNGSIARSHGPVTWDFSKGTFK